MRQGEDSWPVELPDQRAVPTSLRPAELLEVGRGHLPKVYCQLTVNRQPFENWGA